MRIRSIIAAVAVVFSLASHQARAASPSFDCSKAESPLEHALCADDEIAELDAKMARVLSLSLATVAPAQKDRLLANQHQWERLLSSDCALPANGPQDEGETKAAINCLEPAYRRRFVVLNEPLEHMERWAAPEQPLHVPDNFWGIEFIPTGGVNPDPFVSSMWRLGDGSLVLLIILSHGNGPPIIGAVAYNVTTGKNVMSVEESARMVSSKEEEDRIAVKYGMSQLFSAPHDIILARSGATIRQVFPPDHCDAPFRTVITNGSRSIVVAKPFAGTYEWSLDGCGDGLKGEVGAHSAEMDFQLIPLSDGTFLAIQLGVFQGPLDEPASWLVVRFKDDLTSPFFDEPRHYAYFDVDRDLAPLLETFFTTPEETMKRIDAEVQRRAAR